MHAKLQPRASSRSALMFGVVMLAAIGALRSAAKADQDDDAERVPSSAADIYSPIQSTFTPQAPLPGGPQRLVPGTSFPADDGPVLFQDLKERLRFADPFFRDMKLAVYLRTHDFDRDNASRTALARLGRRLGAGDPRPATSTTGCSLRRRGPRRSRCLRPRAKAARCCSRRIRRR